MADLRPIKNNFTNGEIDPLLSMRTDLEAYANGASLMRNVLPLPSGGFQRRPGTEIVAHFPVHPVDPQTAREVVIIRIVNPGAGYTNGKEYTFPDAEVGKDTKYKVRTNSDGGVVSISLADHGKKRVQYSSKTFPGDGNINLGKTGEFTKQAIFKVEYIEHTDQYVRRLVEFSFSKSENYLMVFEPWKYDVFRREDTGSGPNQLLTAAPVDSKVSADYLRDLKWFQHLDVLFLFHPMLPPRKIVRTSEVDWPSPVDVVDPSKYPKVI